MGLFSKIFGSKKKTTTQNTSTSTTTPIVPDWVSAPVQDYSSAISALGKTDPYSWVAPASNLQNQAFAGTDKLGSKSGVGDLGSLMTATSGLSAAPSYDAANGSAQSYGARTGASQSYGASTGAAQSYGATSGAAQSYDATTGSAQSLLDGLGKYMSPYRDDVVKSSMADWDFTAGQQRAQADLDMASSGAFGGSGAAIGKSLLEDNLSRGRQSTVSNLYDRMFNTGAALSSEDAGRRQSMEVANMQAANEAAQYNASQRQAMEVQNMQGANDAGQFNAAQRQAMEVQNMLGANEAGQFNAAQREAMEVQNLQSANEAGQYNAGLRQAMELANMQGANDASQFNATQQGSQLDRMFRSGQTLFDQSTASDANTRANLSSLAALGETQRGITQQQISAPITLLGTQTAMSNGLPLSMFTGTSTTGTGTGSSTQTSTPSLSQAAGQALQIAAMFSDETLKTEVVRVGEMLSGLGIYEYRYCWGGPRRRGVMAQEVLKFLPEAVVTTKSGHLMVDYNLIGAI